MPYTKVTYKDGTVERYVSSQMNLPYLMKGLDWARVFEVEIRDGRNE